MQPELTLATPRASLPGCVALSLNHHNVGGQHKGEPARWIGFLFTLRLSALIRPYRMVVW
ncbi:MAG: hypothetical protein KC423_00410 [Anaerolineales bacterium]|nr:hypothetical protein [Anaerolineales bacterium]